MIRVLHVIGAMDRGGAETMIMNLYRAINRDVIQFDFVVHEQRRCDYDEEIERLGGRIYRVPRFTGVNAVSYRRSFRRFFDEHPEHPIIHGHIGSSCALYLAEAKRAGRYTIAHSHSQNFPLTPSQAAFRVLSYPTRFVADYFMACSCKAGTDRYGRRFSDEHRGKVLENGIDLALYACDEGAHVAAKTAFGLDGVPVIGHVGRLAPEKNHEFLLKTVALVRKQLPDVRLVCVGRGPLLQQEQERARNLGIEDSVTFLGVRTDVPDLLRAFDIFVFPSVKEGLPISAIEAQASGVPSLLSTGVPDEAVVSSNVQRRPLDDGPQVWADRCIALLRGLPPRRDHREDVRAHGFDINDSARWLSAFYGDVAGTR